VTDATPADFEGLLRRAMAPVDPPARLVDQFEQTLTDLTDLAAEELEGWELSSMRDPRNWVRPAVAAVVGVSAGTALVALRVRRRHRVRKARSGSLVELAQRTAHDVAEEAGRILRRKH
jgi:hypothetical protein